MGRRETFQKAFIFNVTFYNIEKGLAVIHYKIKSLIEYTNRWI